MSDIRKVAARIGLVGVLLSMALSADPASAPAQTVCPAVSAPASRRLVYVQIVGGTENVTGVVYSETRASFQRLNGSKRDARSNGACFVLDVPEAADEVHVVIRGRGFVNRVRRVSSLYTYDHEHPYQLRRIPMTAHVEPPIRVRPGDSKIRFERAGVDVDRLVVAGEPGRTRFRVDRLLSLGSDYELLPVDRAAQRQLARELEMAEDSLSFLRRHGEIEARDAMIIPSEPATSIEIDPSRIWEVAGDGGATLLRVGEWFIVSSGTPTYPELLVQCGAASCRVRSFFGYDESGRMIADRDLGEAPLPSSTLRATECSDCSVGERRSISLSTEGEWREALRVESVLEE